MLVQAVKVVEIVETVKIVKIVETVKTVEIVKTVKAVEIVKGVNRYPLSANREKNLLTQGSRRPQRSRNQNHSIRRLRRLTQISLKEFQITIICEICGYTINALFFFSRLGPSRICRLL